MNINTYNSFEMAKQALEQSHKLTPENIKYENDWREMPDKEWDKLVEHFDKYLDSTREELEKLEERQNEAAQKMAAEAPAEMKAIFAAQAALKVAANGFMGVPAKENSSELEKKSWTYKMSTNDQIILAQAKMANEKAANMMAKLREL